MKRRTKYLLVFTGVLIALTPLGLIADGPAWGEWSNEEILEMLGFVPRAIANAKPLVEAAIPDYAVGGMDDLVSTWLSALLGAGVLFAVMFGIKQSAQRER